MEETLKFFLETIEAQARQELEELSADVTARQQADLEAARTQAQRAADRYRERELAQVRNAGAVQVAAQAAENRRKLLQQRQAWAEEVCEDVIARVREFTAGQKYPARLAAMLSQALDTLGRGGIATVYMRKEDFPLVNALRRKEQTTQLNVLEGDMTLGGMIVAKDGRRMDMSFDLALETARARFGELAGLALDGEAGQQI